MVTVSQPLPRQVLTSALTLDSEDNAQDPPFLLPREGEAKLIIHFLLAQDDFPVGAHAMHLARDLAAEGSTTTTVFAL